MKNIVSLIVLSLGLVVCILADFSAALAEKTGLSVCTVSFVDSSPSTKQSLEVVKQDGGKLTDSAALILLKGLQTRYQQLKGLESEFHQRSYLKSLDLEEASKGSLALGLPGRLLWEYTDPEPQQFLLADEEFRLYQPIEKQLIIQSTRSFFLSDIPVSFLLGIGDLSQDFEVKKGCKSSKGVTLTLEPKVVEGRRDEALRELQLSFVPGEGIPVVASVTDSEENITTLVLTNWKKNPSFTKDTFALKVAKDTDIQDLRSPSSGNLQ